MGSQVVVKVLSSVEPKEPGLVLIVSTVADSRQGSRSGVGKMNQNGKKWQVLTEDWRTRDITSHINLVGDPHCDE